MLRSDFPGEWAAFAASKAASPAFTFTLRSEYFPYFAQAMVSQGSKLVVNQLLLYGNDLTPAKPQRDMSSLSAALKQLTTTGSTRLSLNADAAVLNTSSTQVYLLLGYSLTN
jgi:hypothetical protein